MFTLFDLHIGAHEKVGTINYSVSSAGSSLKLNDETESTAHADDQFNAGTIYIIDGSSNLAGKFVRIADYDASSGEYTWSSGSLGTSGGGTTAIGANVNYGRATPEFNLQLMNRLSNAALRTLGPFVYVDRTMQSSANQRVYTLTTLAARSDLFRVDIQTRTGSTTDNPGWTELHGWYLEPSTVGGGHNIIFPRYLPANRDIRVFYEGDHQNITTSTASVDARIHPELATLALVEKMYEFRNSRARGAQEFDVQRWNDAKRQLAEARVRWPIWRPKRKPKILVIGNDGLEFNVSNVSPYGSLE
jgi:hypothetical protein